MSAVDPIADMLTRTRNALMVGHLSVSMPASRLKVAIAEILQEEGFIEGFDVSREEGQSLPALRLRLKYIGERRERRPVITGLERVSAPGRRVYARRKEIPRVKSGMGVAILTTPKGVMTSARARRLGVGGEVLCYVW